MRTSKLGILYDIKQKKTPENVIKCAEQIELGFESLVMFGETLPINLNLIHLTEWNGMDEDMLPMIKQELEKRGLYIEFVNESNVKLVRLM